MLLRLLFAMTLISVPALADQMVYTFKNPQFSGDGYSSHVLTIENQETTRKKQIEADKKAAADAADAAARNTNISKFLNNLESRIYAQLSLQLSNDMFSGGSDTGTLNFQGSTITWLKDSINGMVNLTIIDDKGNRTELEVPIGSFKF
jgi:Type VIII secretion system (T8SS), CsgF protein